MQFFDSINRRLLAITILAIIVLGLLLGQTAAQAKLTHVSTTHKPVVAKASTFTSTKTNVFMYWGKNYPNNNVIRYAQAWNGTKYQYDFGVGSFRTFKDAIVPVFAPRAAFPIDPPELISILLSLVHEARVLSSRLFGNIRTCNNCLFGSLQ